MSGSSATRQTIALQAFPSMGFLQARILEWVAISYSRGYSQGSNPHLRCLLHWQVSSFLLGPPRKQSHHMEQHLGREKLPPASRAVLDQTSQVTPHGGLHLGSPPSHPFLPGNKISPRLCWSKSGITLPPLPPLLVLLRDFPSLNQKVGVAFKIKVGTLSACL